MKIKIQGLKELERALKSIEKSEDKVKMLVKRNGARLHQQISRQAQKGVAFKKGYSKGMIKKTLKLELANDGKTAVVGSNMNYAPYQEYGTRFMSAQPFMKIGMDQVKPLLEKDIENLLKKG